jgi:hypothetical protein
MGEAKITGETASSKRGSGKEDTMKKSLLTQIAALAISLAFPLGAFAAPAAKMTTDGSVSKEGQTHRKHYFAHPWLDS